MAKQSRKANKASETVTEANTSSVEATEQQPMAAPAVETVNAQEETPVMNTADTDIQATETVNAEATVAAEPAYQASDAAPVETVEPAAPPSPYAELMEGLNLTSDLATFRQAKSAAERKIASLNQAIAGANVELREAEEQLTAAEAMGDRRQAAENMAAALLSVGLTQGAVRAAMIAHFGRASAPKAAPKALALPVTADGTLVNPFKGEKKVTHNLPAETVDKVAEVIRASGKDGIRMDHVWAAFEAGQDQKDRRSALFAAVKNFMIDGNVLKGGTTRGTRYFWVS